MKHNKSLILLAGLLLFSIVLAACSPAVPADVAPAESVSTEAPADAGTGFPTGKFLKEYSMNSGLVFNKDGTFSVFASDTTVITGTYSVEGTVFTETSNTGGCDTNMSFNYVFDGKKLTFNYVGNPDDDADCTGRYADFNNVTYILTK